MGLQEVCDSLVEETDGLLACIVLDFDTGLALATACRERVDAAAVATVTSRLGGLFRSKSLALSSPKHAGGLVREAQVTFGNTYHFMATLPGWSSALLVFVTERAVSIGLGWMAVHQALDRVVHARPGTVAAEAEAEPRSPPPSAPQDHPAPADARSEPLRGAGSGATSPFAHSPPRQTAKPVAPPPRRPMPPATQTPGRQGTAPATPPRKTPPRVTQTPPPVGSFANDRPVGGRDMQQPKASVPAAEAAGVSEPPMLDVPGAPGQRTRRQAPTVRPRAPSPIPAAGAKAARPAVEEDAKTDVGRMGARAVFGSKARRS